MLDKNIKYIYNNQEKYKANYSQSKSTGQIFFDVSITANTLDELENESRNAINRCIKVCNEKNKIEDAKKKKPVSSPSNNNKARM